MPSLVAKQTLHNFHFINQQNMIQIYCVDMILFNQTNFHVKRNKNKNSSS